MLEPILQPITNERLHHSTANTEDGARVNIKAQGFWENDSVFLLMLGCWIHLLLSPTLHQLQKTWARKEKAYGQHIR